jgi:hypothetical protein
MINSREASCVTRIVHAHSSSSSNTSKASITTVQNAHQEPSQPHRNHSVATMATTDSVPIIKVLFTLHEGMDAMDFVGPLEVLSQAKHSINDDCKSIASISMDFECLDPNLPRAHKFHNIALKAPLIFDQADTVPHSSDQSLRHDLRLRQGAYRLRPRC